MRPSKPESFLEGKDDDMFYVGFLKSAREWFPLTVVSDPEGSKQLDTLLISDSYRTMSDALEDYRRRIPQVEDIFVQYLMPQEIRNLIDRYALTNILEIELDDETDGCGCGCGCS